MVDVAMSQDVSTASHSVWWDEHINDIDAAAAIRAAPAVIRSGEDQLAKAVLQARSRDVVGKKYCHRTDFGSIRI